MCSAEEAAASYIQAVQQEQQLPSTASSVLGFMPKETRFLLSQTGALNAFAPPPRERREGEKVTIWEHGNDALHCTIKRPLGKGGQGWVYEVDSDVTCDGDHVRALKCANFCASKGEALVFLRLNYKQSHRNVLAVDFVYSPPGTTELLCVMERVQGPREDVRDLHEAIKDGILYKGDAEVVTKSLFSLVLQLAFAVEYMHSQGVVHQDIKRTNLLIDGSDTVDWRLVLRDCFRWCSN